MQELNIIKLLFDKYTKNECTPQETEQLIAVFQSGEHKDYLEELISAYLSNDVTEDRQNDSNIQEILNRVQSRINTSLALAPAITQPKWKIYKPLMLAASILIISTIAFLLYNKQQPIPVNDTITEATKILPGSNKATLTLADGKTISLTDAQNGKLAEQTGIKITKASDGQLVYNSPPSGGEVADRGGFNAITTPKGGQYQVILPDGTKVWLNAASSLKYPLVFNGGERKVELTGEAYFEVTHNKAMPFSVKTATQTVEVLGTHFNVNAYTNENREVTTLAEGAVRVTVKQLPGITLKPGQQAINALGDIAVKPADVETALAWKNGKIYFKDADIQTIMRQVARWYNINIEYQGNIPKRTFNGGVSRSSNLATLLSILEQNNIHFELKNQTSEMKTLLVKP